MMTRPALVRSIPFWALGTASAATAAAGLWIVVDKLTLMTVTLSDGSATPVDVYAGQSWATVGAALLAAGLVGVFATLGIVVVGAIVRPAPGEQPERPAGVEETDEPTPAETAFVEEPLPLGR